MLHQLSYQGKQIINYASLIKKLANNEAVHIVCQGDSMTYGHDTMSSDIRPKKSDPTCEKTAEYPDHEQAGQTYPEALQTFCNKMYGTGKISITNRGYSGDWAEMSRKRWSHNPNADLHLLMLGTNDASNPFIPIDVQQHITKYVEDMSKLIEQILDFQSAIILLTPPKHSNEENLLIVAYRQSLKLVGKKYNIPVIDTTEFLKGYPFSDVQSDEVHYNTKGYTIFAAKIGSLIAGLSHIYEPYTIDSNQIITPSFNEYGLTFNRKGSKVVTLEEHQDAPYGIGSIVSKGLRFRINSQSSLTLSFYANRPHLLVTPLFNIQEETGSLSMILDFGIQPGHSDHFNLWNDDQASDISSITSEITFTGISYQNVNDDHGDLSNVFENSFLLPMKGFHSISIENTSLSDDVYVYGLFVTDLYSFHNR